MRKPASPVAAARGAIADRSVVHAVPTRSLISSESVGLHMASQRRCVTPLVLLLNRSGHSSAKSRKSPDASRSEWSCATPLTEHEPTMAR